MITVVIIVYTKTSYNLVRPRQHFTYSIQYAFPDFQRKLLLLVLSITATTNFATTHHLLPLGCQGYYNCLFHEPINVWSVARSRRSIGHFLSTLVTRGWILKRGTLNFYFPYRKTKKLKWNSNTIHWAVFLRLNIGMLKLNIRLPQS